MTLLSSTVTNDSDVTFELKSNKTHTVQSIWVELAATATVGNRQIEIQFQDPTGDVIGVIRAGVVQAESLTRKYFFGGALDITSFRDTDLLMVAMPAIKLDANFKIRVFDNNAIAAAADDMVVHILIDEQAA